MLPLTEGGSLPLLLDSVEGKSLQCPLVFLSSRCCMNGAYSRRAFLKDTAMTAAAIGTLQTALHGADTSAARGSWRIACRDAHLKETGAADCWAAFKAIQADGLEVDVDGEGACSSLFGPAKYGISTPEDVERLGKALAEHKAVITAFCMHNRFDERPDEEVKMVVKVAQAARKLHVPAIRLDVVPRKIKDDSFLPFAIDIGKRVVRETEDIDVRFGVENHGGTTNRPDFLRPFLKGVGSDRFGLTLDTANFYWFGHPLPELYRIYDEFADAVCHTHCKNIRYPESEREKKRPTGWEYGKYNCPVYEGDIDFKRVASILQKHNYKGDLCIENESLGKFPEGERGRVLAREVQHLREVSRA